MVFWENMPSLLSGGVASHHIPASSQVVDYKWSFVMSQHPRMSAGGGFSDIAQLVEQVTVNHWVVGSSPTVGAILNSRGKREECK